MGSFELLLKIYFLKKGILLKTVAGEQQFTGVTKKSYLRL